MTVLLFLSTPSLYYDDSQALGEASASSIFSSGSWNAEDLSVSLSVSLASALARLSPNPWCLSYGHPPISIFILRVLDVVWWNGSFIVSAAGNGSWEAVDGSSLPLPPLANALFYQSADERSAPSGPPRVYGLFSLRAPLRHAACCYANRLSESSVCSSSPRHARALVPTRARALPLSYINGPNK